MELRSRSRSNTPFLRRSIDKEVSNTGNHVTKTTRRTVKTVETVSEGKKSRKSTRGHIVTSDYSSEDGEAYVSSTDAENANNRWREQNMNGNGSVSALKFYKQAGEYWNKFPKTDYTYSRHSKDRVEIAPGVVAMPNMSRRSLHSNCTDVLLNKQTNTETSYAEDRVDYASSSASSTQQQLQRKKLFTSTSDATTAEDEEETFVINRRSLREVTIVERIYRLFVSVVTVVFFPFAYVYGRQQSLFLWLGRVMHKMTSLVMLWDTWLLRRSNSAEKKLAGVVGLCLVPLLLFGGFWAIYGAASLIENGLSTLRGPEVAPVVPVIPIFTQEDDKIQQNKISNTDNAYFFTKSFEDRIAEIVKNMGLFGSQERTSRSTPEDAEVKLSEEQLKTIADYVKREVISNDDVIIERILENPYIQNVINNYEVNSEVKTPVDSVDKEVYDKQNLIIDGLRKEILKIRNELSTLNNGNRDELMSLLQRFNLENRKETAKLSLELKKCCRTSFVQIEAYVSKILKDLFNAPSDIKSSEDTLKWLNSIFIARDDLEAKLSNLTQNLRAEFDATIENNGKLLMDRINLKISNEFVGKSVGDVKIDFDDDRIRRIVTEALEVYDADKTGLVDYAMESAGGQVVSARCTESYQSKTAVVSVLGIPIWYPANTPRTVITPGVNPGECWAFQNFPGFLIIKLSGKVNISAFTMEHLSRKLASNGKVDSAPKDFEVYGLRNESEQDPVLLGKFRYDHDGKPLQFFRSEKAQSFDLIELRILSNHGNPNYTCLYRFRVHGVLEST